MDGDKTDTLLAVAKHYERAIDDRDEWKRRAEAAETALAAEFVYAIDLVNRYGEDMRKRGTKGQPSIEFTHWKAVNE